MKISDEDLLNPERKDEMDWLPALASGGAAEPIQERSLDDVLAARGTDAPTGPGENELALAGSEYSPKGDKQRLMLSIIDALTGGNEASAYDARKMARADALGKARLADSSAAKARGYVDKSTAELLMSGGMSAEAAGNTRRDSDALRLVNNLGQLETRRRGQDLAAEQKAADVAAKAEKARMDDERARALAADRNKTTIEAAKLRKSKGGGVAAPMTPEQKAKQEERALAGDAALLAGSANTTPEQAAAFIRGETLDLPPDALDRLKISKGLLDSGNLDRGKASLAAFNRESSNTDAPGRTEATQQANVEAKRKLRDDLNADKATLTAAITGWKSLSPDAQKILVQYGGMAPSQLVSALKSSSLSEQEQIAAARVQRLVNEDIKRMSGSAVSVSEGGRTATGVGMSSGDFNPWQSPAVLTDYLKHARKLLEDRWNSGIKAYPDLFKAVK